MSVRYRFAKANRVRLINADVVARERAVLSLVCKMKDGAA